MIAELVQGRPACKAASRGYKATYPTGIHGSRGKSGAHASRAHICSAGGTPTCITSPSQALASHSSWEGVGRLNSTPSQLHTRHTHVAVTTMLRVRAADSTCVVFAVRSLRRAANCPMPAGAPNLHTSWSQRDMQGLPWHFLSMQGGPWACLLPACCRAALPVAQCRCQHRTTTVATTSYLVVFSKTIHHHEPWPITALHHTTPHSCASATLVGVTQQDHTVYKKVYRMHMLTHVGHLIPVHCVSPRCFHKHAPSPGAPHA